MSGRRGWGLLSAGLVAVCATLVGCAATKRGELPDLDPSVSARTQGALTEADAVGVWALTDRRNSTFNVRLGEDGHAVSTWSAGPSGALGERGRWSILDGRVVVDWENGWQDTLAVGVLGIEQWSWGPGADRRGLPTTFGMAVQLREPGTEFIGVWQMRGVLPGDPSVIYVAIQSDGMVFKSIGTVRYGCWAPVPAAQSNGRSGLVARITWANGWYDELRAGGDGYVVETWMPETGKPNPSGPPTATNAARLVR